MADFDCLPLMFPNVPQDVILAAIDDVTINFGAIEEDEKLAQIVSQLSALSSFSEPADPESEDVSIQIATNLQEMIPDADPDYLLKIAGQLSTYSENERADFISERIKSKDYPTLKDYEKRLENRLTIANYTTNFDIEDFVNQFPNPQEHFTHKDYRNPLLDEDGDANEQDEKFALSHIYNHYRDLRKRDIETLFNLSGKNIQQLCSKLDKLPKAFKNTTRKVVEYEVQTENIRLAQEIAYVLHKKDIILHIKLQNEQYRLAKSEAKRLGILETCQNCFTPELLPEECFLCRSGCIFCAECIQGGTEAQVSSNTYHFPCYNRPNCQSEFSLSTIKMVVPSKLFNTIAHRVHMMELKNANIAGVEFCPVCLESACIVNPNDKIFYCSNPECRVETCRECNHPSHIPLRCSEIEYDEDVLMRTRVEEAMSESLIRICNRCSNPIIKESGCNKMVCTCGMMMCYVCKKTISGYDHFQNSSCPTYTTNEKSFELQKIQAAAKKAKDELGIGTSGAVLKFDPTKDIANYYQ